MTTHSLYLNAIEWYLSYPLWQVTERDTAISGGQPASAGGHSQGVGNGPGERRGRGRWWGQITVGE